MISFKSRREKKLWIITAILLVTIFCTLGLAGSIAMELKKYGLEVAPFLLGCFLAVIMVFIQAFRRKASRNEIWAWIGIIAIYVFAFVRITSPIERSHLVEYGIVSILILEALTERRKHGVFKASPYLSAAIATWIISVMDEVIQLWIPNRVFDWDDILFNTIAVTLAISSSKVLSLIRAKRSS
ncbi:MAG: VanZ family protein [bacterium]|nr:VanZ family protein [bacterium]